MAVQPLYTLSAIDSSMISICTPPPIKSTPLRLLKRSENPKISNSATKNTKMDLQVGFCEPYQSLETNAIDPTKTNSARTAAFLTNGILHLIISSVPEENYANLRRVSKTWCSVVLSIGYHVDPVDVSIHADQAPAYAETVPIAFHPTFVFHTYQRKALPASELRSFGFGLDCALKFHATILHKFGHQFLTSPPVTQTLLTGMAFKDGKECAVLRAPHGIRFRDLAEALPRLGDLDAGGACREEKCEGRRVSISLRCAKGAHKEAPSWE
jgi:hypothetical protein